MTREDAKAMLLNIEMIKAFAAGEDVQQGHPSAGGWTSSVDFTFCAPPDYYRIKPKPREFWINEYPPLDENSPATMAAAAHRTKEDADRGAGVNRISCIHVQELPK